MTVQTNAGSGLKWAAWIAGTALVLSIVSVGERFEHFQAMPAPREIAPVFLIYVFYWLLWGGVAVIAFRAFQWLSTLEHAGPARIALTMGTIVLVTSCVLYLFDRLSEPFLALGPMTQVEEVRRRYWTIASSAGLFVFVGFLANAVQAYRERQARVAKQQQLLLENQRLATALVAARLDVLKTQIHPHLVFNALNGVAALIAVGDSTAAYNALTKLGDLLRNTFRAMDRERIELGEEFALITQMFEIGAMRYGERFSWSIELPGELARVELPPFLVQPLAENALVHAVGGSSGAVHVVIRASIEADNLRVEVCDNGQVGVDPARAVGAGLKNLGQRVSLLGGALSTDCGKGESQLGYAAILRLPLTHVTHAVQA